MVVTRITRRQHDVWAFYKDQAQSGTRCAAALGITNQRVYQICVELWGKSLMYKSGHFWRAIPGDVEITVPRRGKGKRAVPYLVHGVRPYRERRL